MTVKYPINLRGLTENEILKLTDIFMEIGKQGRFRLDQEGEDRFRLKCREIADEIAKNVINNERKRFGL